jgi:hypothetical protein
MPGSPRNGGPPFQAYQYVRRVPSASVLVMEFMPLSWTRILRPICNPIIEIIAAVRVLGLLAVLAQYADRGAVLRDHLNTTDGEPSGLGAAHGAGHITLPEEVATTTDY